MKIEIKDTIVEKTIFEIDAGECFHTKYSGEIYIKTDRKIYDNFAVDKEYCSACDIIGWDCVNLNTGEIRTIRRDYIIFPLSLKVVNDI
jgi:hypothetical protein